MRDEIQKEYTLKQRKLFNLPEIVEEGNEYVLQNLGSKASLSARGGYVGSGDRSHRSPAESRRVKNCDGSRG